MPLSDRISVTVNLTAPGVTRAGFGVPAIFTTSPTWVERSRTYTSITGVGADFATTSPEYLAAQALFAQSPAPSSIKIIRGTLKPTMVATIKIDTVIQPGQAYSVNVFVNGVKQTATYTSVSADTNDLIVAGLVSAINALAAPAPNFTAAATGTVGSKIVTCTGNAAGNWFAIEPLPANPGNNSVVDIMEMAETTTDPGVATDLNAINLADSAWYGLVILFHSSAYILAVAAWVESNTKIMMAASADTQCATVADSIATDVAHAAKVAGYTRTGIFFHPRMYEFPDAAKEGRWLPVDPGGDNWTMKTYVGVTPVNFSATQQTNLLAKNAAFYYLFGGQPVDGGNGTDASGEFTDVARFIDWYVANTQADMANIIIQNNKAPYTDAGIELFANVLRNWNTKGIAAGGINPGSPPAITPPFVTTPTAGSQASSDRQNRIIRGLSSNFFLAGAINKAFVTVNVSQ